MSREVTMKVQPIVIPNNPAFNLAGDNIVCSCIMDNLDPLSSDTHSLVAAPIASDGFIFHQKITISKLSRSMPREVRFKFERREGAHGEPHHMGTATISSHELIKHGDFVTTLRARQLVGPYAKCPLDVKLEGAEFEKGTVMALQIEIVEGAKNEVVAGVGGNAVSDDTCFANIFVSAKDILATRGASTDSFIRLMLVLEGEVEHEIGRTEICNDTLSPEFTTYVPLSYSVSAATKPNSKTLVRFEVCDPGTTTVKGSGGGDNQKKEKKDKVKGSFEGDDFTTIGAQQLLLGDIHKNVTAGSGGPAGVARVELTLRQKGELQGLLKAEEKPKNYGKLFAVMEQVQADEKVCWLVLGAKKLKTNKLSLRPDPFLKIFREIPTLEGDTATFSKEMPTRCPIYVSNYVKHTREAAWKTSPIPLQLLSNGDDQAKLTIEVWDFQYNASDRMIGFCHISAGELLASQESGPQNPMTQKYSPLLKLSPPGIFQATTSTVDRVGSILTGGTSSQPGELSVLSAEVYENKDLADTHADCFDVDTVLREKKASQPIQWEALRDRRHKIIAKVRFGVVDVHSTSCGKRLGKWRRDWKNYMATVGVTKYLYRYAPFYVSKKKIGARFGSAFEAFFSFSYLLIQLNLLLALVWFLPVVLPQLLMMDPAPDGLEDLLEALNARKYVESIAMIAAKSGGDVDTSVLEDFVNSGNITSFRPGVLLFSGYLPKFEMDKLSSSFGLSLSPDGALYQMDFAYVACILAMVCISLFTVVCALGGQVAAVTETSSKARTDGAGQVMEYLFGGWDHLERSSTGTSNTRYFIVTQMKEGIHDAQRAAERDAKVLTRRQKQIIFMKRVASMAISFVLLVLSVTFVFYASAPPGSMTPDLKTELNTLSEAFAVPVEFSSLAVTIINIGCPIVIKILVKLEAWDSPETAIRQTLFRQIFVKMINIVVLYMAQQIGSVHNLLPADAIPSPCPEKEAAKQFLSLIIMDCLVQVLILFFGKAVPYYGGRLFGCACGPCGGKSLMDLPTEIVNICYRQTILLVGSVVSPWIFIVGFVTNTIIYAAKYLAMIGMFRPPEKPFKANRMKKIFYVVLLISNLIGLYPVAHFLTSRANPNCGPLRSYSCARQQAFGHHTVHEVDKANATACMHQIFTRRANYAAFEETILPVGLDEFNPIDAMSELIEGNSTLFDQFASNCNASPFACWVSIVLSAVFSSVTLILVLILVCICLCMSRAQSSRLNRQLDASDAELELEHRDKVRLLRYAGVSLD